VKGDSGAGERRRQLELAASHYRWVAERPSDYRPLAALKLMTMYADETGLNQPHEAVPFARLYTQLSASSASGHVQLARLLARTGDAKGATAALLAARTVVTADNDRALLATSIVEHLTTAADVAASDLRALLVYAQRELDAAIPRDPDNRTIVLAKAAALRMRAERIERDPAVQKALLAESDRTFERFRASNTNPSQSQPAAAPATDGPPAEPPGYAAVLAEAESLSGKKQYTQAAAVYEKFMKSYPAYPPPHYLRLTALLAAGQNSAIDSVLQTARAAVPATAAHRHLMATYLVDLEMRTPGLAAADARKLLAEAATVLDEALTLRPKFMESVAYKAVVLNRQARLESDPAKAKALTAEADRLRAEAQALRK
jgi:hypothetical protein